MRDVAGSDGATPSWEAKSPVRFAGLVLNLDAWTLARDSGEAVPLTRGEFALLRMFVARPGRVISRDALLNAFTDRRFESFDRSVDVLVGKLRRRIEPDPKQPRLIVTVPGEGYRFDGLAQPSPTERASNSPPLSQESQGRRRGGDGFFADPPTAQTPMPARREPPRLSIVVLPFANIGGAAEQEHFADGVTESLTTDLSRIRGAVVTARNTAFTYKNKPLDVRTIGHDLNVRYVLEGSVQRAGDRMRVNVQLIDAETSDHIWAERFDKPIADLFDMQTKSLRVWQDRLAPNSPPPRRDARNRLRRPI
jgi:TolB-like protein/DNA-binding winged helix-turn-helix (wHTH) protein